MPPPSEQRLRRSARVILLDSALRVLLIRYLIEREGRPFTFWATPGGGVNAGETDFIAARRELMEELAIDVPISGPIYTTTSKFEHEGEFVTNTDTFFLGRWTGSEIKLGFATESERQAIRDCRWWSVAELAATEETIFPSDLESLVTALIVQL
ncbi:MAG TPA: NUDIX domain-containing protein [Xanthobacteraceae bacterium]